MGSDHGLTVASTEFLDLGGRGGSSAVSSQLHVVPNQSNSYDKLILLQIKKDLKSFKLFSVPHQDNL